MNHELIFFLDVTMTCKVHGCIEKHTSYYCSLCGCKDSAHSSHDCPQGTVLYHGTRLSSIKGVTEEDLKLTSNGCLWQGIHSGESFKDAENVSLHKGEGISIVVFECRVNLGKVKDLNEKKENLTKWRNEKFDSARAIHPSLGDPNKYTELCLKNARKCIIIRVVVTQGYVDDLSVFYEKKQEVEWKSPKRLDVNPACDEVKDNLQNILEESKLEL